MDSWTYLHGLFFSISIGLAGINGFHGDLRVEGFLTMMKNIIKQTLEIIKEERKEYFEKQHMH